VTVARYDGPPLGHEFTKLAPPSSVCFRFIVPWGDTTFNEEQIQVLRDELREAARRRPNQLTRMSELEALSTFLERAVGAHVYVKFIGD
jgi:hypothetical protein